MKHLNNRTINSLIHAFKIPLLVLFGLILYLVLLLAHVQSAALIIVLATITLGSFGLFKETFEDIRTNQFALDYIAILAIVVSLVTKEYLVGAVIALMLSTGRTLEEYGANRAKQSLSLLSDRIPHDVLVDEKNVLKKINIENVVVGQIITVRKGEVIPLDGLLLSNTALIDESSLTGEPYPMEKIQEDELRSGTINVGDVIKLKVTREEKNSTYKKIIALVDQAEKEKAPLVRLADKYSVIFTIVTFVLASFAFLLHRNLESILAVLVVATPCPLILATPIALISGVNAAAKKRIIIKKLASLEVLSRVTTVIFDKTGTITLGKPTVTNFEIKNYSSSETAKAGESRSSRPASRQGGQTRTIQLLAIAEAIERNSLHPLAKAIVQFAKKENAPLLHAESVEEIIGKGIQGKVNGNTYLLSKIPADHDQMAIGLFADQKQLGTFYFTDEIKQESKSIITSLKTQGLSLSIFTGDKKSVALSLAKQLGITIDIHAEMKPEEKQEGIAALKSMGKITAMVGDGINDAPALALADVGMVFSNEEQTAASEAADIVFLGGDFALVLESLQTAKHTIRIAMQSILWGIGLSVLAMILASLGLIPPIFGAILQEGIDIAVILNALRASR